MDANNWFSERLNQWIDLTKLPKKEVIAELFAERKCYLNMEKELGENWFDDV